MWTTALLVIVPTALFVGIVVVLHHYFAPEGGWLRSMEDAGEIFSTVGTGLAVLIAFPYPTEIVDVTKVGCACD